MAYNAPAGQIMVIGRNGATIDRYAEDGAFISSADLVGESANDVDVDMAPVDLFLNGTFLPQGRLLLVNGESDVAEIYAIDEVTSEVIDTLVTAFGVSHVVGGSYHPHPARSSLSRTTCGVRPITTVWPRSTPGQVRSSRPSRYCPTTT